MNHRSKCKTIKLKKKTGVNVHNPGLDRVLRRDTKSTIPKRKKISKLHLIEI